MRTLLFVVFLGLPFVAQAKPDLIVESIAFEDANPKVGEGKILIVFKNIGPDDVDLSFTEFTNYTVALDGNQCDDGTINDLDSGDTNPESTTNCNASSPGPHNITVTIDSDGDVDEADEGNNSKTQSLTWSGPDLIVKSITIDPAKPNVTEGDLTIVFENIGPHDVDLPLTNFTNYTIALDGVQCDDGFISDLGAGKTNEESSSKCGSDTPGPHDITVTIDSESEVVELDETNNTLTKTFTWEGGPDLVIKDITLDPEIPKIENGTLTATIENQGNQGTGLLVNINIKMYLDGEECATGLILAGLGAGKQATEGTGSCNPETPGEHTIRFEVDTDEDVIEADETNNFLEKKFTWTAPDLVITDIVASADPLELDQKNTFTATILNDSTVDAAGLFSSINITMYLDGEECDTGLLLAGLDAGETAEEDTVVCNAKTPGAHVVRFEVDTDEDLVELDETNNFLEKTFVWCGGVEVCNTVDDDCNGETDEGFDIGKACDGDDADTCENGMIACGPDGQPTCVETGEPGVELCNAVDDDCDGMVDEDFSQVGQACDPPNPDCSVGKWACDADGGVECVEGGSDELCNGIDDNCDGQIDEDFEPILGKACATGTGVCRAFGTYVCGDNAVECDAKAGAPAASEVCGNNLDDDCDGLADEGCPCDEGTFLPCGAAVGVCTVGWLACVNGTFSQSCEGAIKAGSETCNTTDDDCDGSVDEGCSCAASRPCGDDAGACAGGTQLCIQGKWADCTADGAPAEQGCTGADDDCNGIVDDGCACDPDTQSACATAPDDCAKYARTCTSEGQWGACTAIPGTENPACAGGDDTTDTGDDTTTTGGDTTTTTGGDDTGDTGDTGGEITGGPDTTAGDTGGEPGPGDSPGAPPAEDGGCASTPGSSGSPFALGLVMLALLALRRRATAP